MAINGFVKMLYQNYLLGLELSSATASSGDIEYSYDNDRDTEWISVGSDDTTTETLEYEFTANKDIDRLHVCGTNWKEFIIEYWNGSAWDDFTNVIDQDNGAPVTGISYTDNANACLYFEFDSVNTLKLKFSPVKTFVADEQKTLTEAYVGQEIGTFVDDILCAPNKVKFQFSDGEKKITLSNMATRQYIKGRKAKIGFTLKQLWETSDQALMSTAYSLREVAIYLCGGEDNYTKEGYRISDIYNGLISRPEMAEHSIGRDKEMGYNYKFDILEV